MFEWFKKDRPNQLELVVSNKTIIRVVFVVIASFVFLAAVRQASHAITLIFTAVFLAIALNAPVHWLSRHMPGKLEGNRSVATGLSFLIIVILIGGFLASIVPPLVKQTGSFLQAAPGLVDDIRSENGSVGQFVRRNHLEDQLDKVSSELSDKVNNASGSAVSTVSRVGGNVFSVLTVLVLTFMMLIEGPGWLKLVQKLTPHDQQKHSAKLAHDMYKVVRGYVNGQVLLAAMAALLIVVPLFILNISYPVALMVIVFFCGLIPMVGHFIGATIVTSVALFTSVGDAVIILSYYILYQQIENYVIQPSIQANTTNMSPLLVFSSVIIGVSFGGLLGGLVAIPVAGCIRVLVLDYIDAKHLLSGNKTPSAEAK